MKQKEQQHIKSYEKIRFYDQLSYLFWLYYSFFSNKPSKRFSVSLELTTKCNARCSFCSRWKKDVTMDRESVVKTIVQAKKEGCFFLAITGGEPLLYEHLEIVLQTCENQKLPVSVNTNGILLEQKKELLLKYKHVFLGINVSLHSHNKKIHDDILGVPGAFDKTIGAMKTLKKDIPFKITATITRENFKEIGLLCDLAEKEKVACRLQPVHDEKTDDLTPWKENVLFSAEQKHELKKVMDKIIATNAHEYKDRQYYKKFVTFFYEPLRMLNNLCITAGRTIYFVSPEGDVFPCESRRDMVLGNIHQKSFKEILVSKKALQWRKTCKKRKNKCVCMYACVAPMNLMFEFFPFFFPLDLFTGFPVDLLWKRKDAVSE